MADCFPLVEAFLYEWGRRRHEPIPVPISSAYELPSRMPKANPRPSLQERWVLSRQDVLQVDAAVRRLPDHERAYVALRYAELARPAAIAKALGLRPGQVQAVRQRALTILAVALRLWPPQAADGGC